MDEQVYREHANELVELHDLFDSDELDQMLDHAQVRLLFFRLKYSNS